MTDTRCWILCRFNYQILKQIRINNLTAIVEFSGSMSGVCSYMTLRWLSDIGFVGILHTGLNAHRQNMWVMLIGTAFLSYNTTLILLLSYQDDFCKKLKYLYCLCYFVSLYIFMGIIWCWYRKKIMIVISESH